MTSCDRVYTPSLFLWLLPLTLHSGLSCTSGLKSHDYHGYQKLSMLGISSYLTIKSTVAHSTQLKMHQPNYRLPKGIELHPDKVNHCQHPVHNTRQNLIGIYFRAVIPKPRNLGLYTIITTDICGTINLIVGTIRFSSVIGHSQALYISQICPRAALRNKERHN